MSVDARTLKDIINIYIYLEDILKDKIHNLWIIKLLSDIFLYIYKKFYLDVSNLSINVGTITESTRKADIFSVLNDIPIITQLISPRDVRDAVMSTWANFKLTTQIH
jgi:hypothetical protein